MTRTLGLAYLLVARRRPLLAPPRGAVPPERAAADRLHVVVGRRRGGDPEAGRRRRGPGEGGVHRQAAEPPGCRGRHGAVEAIVRANGWQGPAALVQQVLLIPREIGKGGKLEGEVQACNGMELAASLLGQVP